MVPRRTLIAAAVAFSLGTACVQPFDAPSAYSTQRFLCDPQNAQVYAQEVADCRQQLKADGGCAGVLSFKGTLGDRPVVVESMLHDSRLSVLPQDGSQAPLIDEVEVHGKSPYFAYDAKFRSMGGALATDGGTRALTFNSDPNSLPDPLQDDKVLFQLRISGADSFTYVGRPGSATIEEQSPADIIGSFSGSFGPSPNHLDGCFHIFPEKIQAEAAPIQ